MSDTSTFDLGLIRDATGPSKRPKADWPLIGDIVAHRAGVPEHLIHWRRSEGASDPEPQS